MTTTFLSDSNMIWRCISWMPRRLFLTVQIISWTVETCSFRRRYSFSDWRKRCPKFCRYYMVTGSRNRSMSSSLRMLLRMRFWLARSCTDVETCGNVRIILSSCNTACARKGLISSLPSCLKPEFADTIPDDVTNWIGLYCTSFLNNRSIIGLTRSGLCL